MWILHFHLLLFTTIILHVSPSCAASAGHVPAGVQQHGGKPLRRRREEEGGSLRTVQY